MFIYNMTKTTEWTDNGPKAKYTFDFEFEGKEEYLEQKAGWRAEYKELSARIRQYKTWRKPRLRPDEMTSYEVYGTLRSLQEQARMMNQMIVQAKAASYQKMLAECKAA